MGVESLPDMERVIAGVHHQRWLRQASLFPKAVLLILWIVVDLIDQQPATGDLIVGGATDAALEAGVWETFQQSGETRPVTALPRLLCDVLPVVTVAWFAGDTPERVLGWILWIFTTSRQDHRVLASKAKNL